MRRLLAVLLSLLIVMTVAGCSGEKREVDKALQGTWKGSWQVEMPILNKVYTVSVNYTFRDGMYSFKNKSAFSSEPDQIGTGKYTIDLESGEITLDASNGVFRYIFDQVSGTIRLWDESGIELKKQ